MDKSVYSMQWDDAQFCQKCNKHFIVQGSAPYTTCPDCGGELTDTSTEQADQIEKMMGFFDKSAGFLGMDRKVVQSFHTMIAKKDGQIFKCDSCGEITFGDDISSSATQDKCPKCDAQMRVAKPSELNAEALLRMPQSDVKDFRASSLTEYTAFCPACGKTTRDTQPPRYCSHCGASLDGRRASSTSSMWLYYVLLIAMAAGMIALFLHYLS